MLGIKRYKSFSLDLWVGEERDFFCEFKKEGSLESLENLSHQDHRHLGFLMKENSGEKLFFKKLKDLLDENKLSQTTRRITFLSTSLSHHDKLWEELSEIFPS